MGLYRRTEDGTAYWWASYTIGGKRVRESTKTSDKEEAKKFLAARIVGNTIPNKSSVGALLDNLIVDYEVNGKDAKWCRIYVEKHIRPFFGGIKAERIDKATINAFIKTKLDAKYRNATINRCIALLRRAYTLGEVPFPRIEKLDENNVRTGFVDDTRFFALYEKLPNHQRPVALFAYETGCRRGEVLKLKWNQIDFIHRVVRLNPGETKNKEGRVIPLSDLMYWLLKKMPRVSDYIFTYRGKPMKSIKQGWGEAQAESEHKLLFHDLRRSAVRNMVRAGVPERVAMAVSGHKTRSIFDRYNIVDEADLKDAMQSLSHGRKFMFDPTKTPGIQEFVRAANARAREEEAAKERERANVLNSAAPLETGLETEIVRQLVDQRRGK